ncbi:MAG: glycosyltransferase family 2 protein [Eubacteriales bacterium]|nr:glycosyltransferase family 2 protein [Eubacteriales bacterium]
MADFSDKKRINKQIAVIMPAYNAERYLVSAAESILSQTYRDLTLLIVNDGSSDSTEEIIRELAEKDARVRALTLPNGGPAKARNAGLDYFLSDSRDEAHCSSEGSASPDYIMFCDADDEYLPDAFEKAVTAADDGSTQGADIVFLGFTIINPDKTTNNYSEPDAEYTPETIGTAFTSLYKANLLNQVWGKLFRADLIRDNGFRFPDYRWGEDRLFIYDCLEASKKISVSSYCCYLYKMYNSASLISGYYDRKPEVCRISDGRVRELCKKFGVTDDKDCRYMYLKSVFSCLTNLYSPTCKLSDQEKRAYAGRILKDEYVRERVKGTGGGTAAKAISALLRTGSISLNLSAAKVLSAVSGSTPLLMQKIKHKK